MLYGPNFGGPDLATAPVKYAATARIDGERATLMGIATTPAARDRALAHATDRRRIHAVAKGATFGLYVLYR